MKQLALLLILGVALSFASDISSWQGQYYTGNNFNQGAYNFQFDVYDDQNAGSLCYTNSTNLTTGYWGQWQTYQYGVATSCFDSSKDYWLKISIDGVEQTPRRLLKTLQYIRKDTNETTTGTINASVICDSTSCLSEKLNSNDQRYNKTLDINYLNISIQNLILDNTSINARADLLNASLIVVENIQNGRYAGFKDNGNWTDNGDGTITFSNTLVALYDNHEWLGKPIQYTLQGGTTGIGGIPAVPDQTTSFMVADFNSGTPIMNIITDRDLIHQSGIVPYLSISRNGNEMYVLEWNNMGNGMPERLNDRLVRTERFTRESGLVLDEHPTRIVHISSGVIWYGTTRTTVNESWSNVSGLDFWYHNETGEYFKNESMGNQWQNMYYCNGSGLQTLPDGQYAVNWVYAKISNPSEADIIIGIGNYTSLADAKLEGAPQDLPPFINYQYTLVGRIIFLKGADIGDIGSSWTQMFTNSQPVNHNDLADLQGGAIGEYYHVTQNQYNALINNQWMNITDQRYNETSKINSVNATVNSLLTSNTTTNAKIDSLNATVQSLIDVNFYGGMYNATAGQTLNLNGVNTWQNTTAWGAGLEKGWYMNGTNAMVCNQSGIYSVTISRSMTVNANDELQFRMTVNNVVEPKSLMRQQFSNGNYQAISYSFLRDFTTGDNIRFEVRDITASNKILTTDNKNIVVLRVG